MKLPKAIRITLWVIIILLAATGVPLAGPVPLIFKKDDQPPVTTELVEEKEESDEQETVFSM